MVGYLLIGIFFSVFVLFSMTGICKSLIVILFSLPLFFMFELGLVFFFVCSLRESYTLIELIALGDIAMMTEGYGDFSTITLLFCLIEDAITVSSLLIFVLLLDYSSL